MVWGYRRQFCYEQGTFAYQNFASTVGQGLVSSSRSFSCFCIFIYYFLDFFYAFCAINHTWFVISHIREFWCLYPHTITFRRSRCRCLVAYPILPSNAQMNTRKWTHGEEMYAPLAVCKGLTRKTAVVHIDTLRLVVFWPQLYQIPWTFFLGPLLSWNMRI